MFEFHINYENTFFQKMIMERGLSDIICENTDIKMLQKNVFLTKDEANPLIPCDDKNARAKLDFEMIAKSFAGEYNGEYIANPNLGPVAAERSDRYGVWIDEHDKESQEKQADTPSNMNPKMKEVQPDAAPQKPLPTTEETIQGLSQAPPVPNTMNSEMNTVSEHNGSDPNSPSKPLYEQKPAEVQPDKAPQEHPPATEETTQGPPQAPPVPNTMNPKINTASQHNDTGPNSPSETVYESKSLEVQPGTTPQKPLPATEETIQGPPQAPPAPSAMNSEMNAVYQHEDEPPNIPSNPLYAPKPAEVQPETAPQEHPPATEGTIHGTSQDQPIPTSMNPVMNAASPYDGAGSNNQAETLYEPKPVEVQSDTAPQEKFEKQFQSSNDIIDSSDGEQNGIKSAEVSTPLMELSHSIDATQQQSKLTPEEAELVYDAKPQVMETTIATPSEMPLSQPPAQNIY